MKPLAGLKVVSCRPEAQSVQLQTALREAGAIPILMPLLEVVPPSDGGGALADALKQLANFDWVTFTSTNAVHAFVEHFDGPWPERPRIATVGTTTTKLLENLGFVVHFTSDESTAAALGSGIPISSGHRILALLGDRAASTLETGLAARGAIVLRAEAYRTLWTDPGASALAAAITADYVLLTSPAIAERFSQVVEAGPKAVCIGPTTAAVATELGFDVVGVATKRNPEGLIAALVNTIG